MLSVETAQFLLELLNRQQLSVGALDFDNTVTLVLKAREELGAIIGQVDALPVKAT